MHAILYVVGCVHIILCPFTKVEESFNIQATHDLLFHNFNISKYDHLEFPGVVPRTFLGPIVLAAMTSPFMAILHLMHLEKFYCQYIVRICLAFCVIVTWNRLRKQLTKIFGKVFGYYYTAFTVTQYHFMFYMSRTLPNILALPLVLLAFEGWISGNKKKFIISAGASIIIFRSELALLFGIIVIFELILGRSRFLELIKIIIPAGVVLVALTVAVDSIFWGRILWPEAEVFYFNTVLNKSSAWGTSPFLWYFYSAIPRGLGPSAVLLPVGLWVRKSRFVLLPALLYVFIYSFLPHKELRFIIYIFPILNVGLAAACDYLLSKFRKSEMISVALSLIILGNIAFSLTLLRVSMTNYPGGEAMMKFHRLVDKDIPVDLHICNLAAQTGVTRFLELNQNWTYDKTENLEPEQLQKYSHLLIEAKSKYSPNLKPFSKSHTVLSSVDVFSHLSFTYKSFSFIKIKTKPSLFILKSRQNNEKSRLTGEVEPINEDIIENEMVEKSLNDLKLMKQQIKDKLIANVRTETKDNVIASAKAKLKEFIAKHKQKDPEYVIENLVDAHGHFEENEDQIIDVGNLELPQTEKDSFDNFEVEKLTELGKDENIGVIVNEVVIRMIDRQIISEPNDLTNDDRSKIHNIVEEVISEKLQLAQDQKQSVIEKEQRIDL